MVGGMSALPIAVVGERERAAAVAAIVAAFTDDPVERWLYPEHDRYQVHFPEFVAAFGAGAFERGTVWKLGDLAAVALWLGPGVAPDGDAIVSVLAATVASDKHEDTFAVLEQMDRAHPPFPHWYLPWFGVAPALQGRGLGGRLLAHCLDVVDRSGLPAYLETPNPRTIAFYERHGFRRTGVARAGGCPPVTSMLRRARGRSAGELSGRAGS
jgi:ribosomal protein S18 acetylase RimI-like enzyme